MYCSRILITLLLLSSITNLRPVNGQQQRLPSNALPSKKQAASTKIAPKKKAKAPINCDSNKISESNKVLNPALFQGQVRTGYTYAKANPALTKQLFCYCGCDYTESHRTLLDCYTDKNKHAADCKECVDELILAWKMLGQGQSISAIQNALHKRWAPFYPWGEATGAYKDYLSSAGLKFINSKLAEPLPLQSEATETTTTTSSPNEKPKECCGDDK